MKFFFAFFGLIILCILICITYPHVKWIENDINYLPSSVAEQNSFSNSLILPERDTVSFYINSNQDEQANLSLIIHHETWIINDYPESKTVTILNPTPKDKKIHLLVCPTFGKEALMGQSMIPNFFHPVNVTVLDKPVTHDDGNYVNYTWENITINPHAAVIVAYAYYYENRSEVFSNNSINLPSVKIIRSYDRDNSSFLMNYYFTNTGSLPLHHPKFVLFLPETVNDISLVESPEILINASCKMDIFNKTTYNDGTGKFSTGSMISSYCPEYLGNNGQLTFSIRTKGVVKNSGNIYPSLIVGYTADGDLYNQTGKISRIWPATELSSPITINLTRFYYYETSVSIPENQYFIIEKSSDTFSITPSQFD